MQVKEEKICSFTQKGKRIQLLKTTETWEYIGTGSFNRYQVRVNRKIIENTISESTARKKFASLIISEVLQQKFTF